MLFKDEVRVVGEELGLPENMVWRQPFPGPGLAIRIIGDVTEERLHILREADAIFLEEIRQAGLYRRDLAVVRRAARYPKRGGDGRRTHLRLPHRRAGRHLRRRHDGRLGPPALRRCWSASPRRIINEVPGVNRVVLDISSKPPSTIEWE